MMPPEIEASTFRRLEEAIRENTLELKEFRLEVSSTYVRQDVEQAYRQYEANRTDVLSQKVATHDSWLTWGLRLLAGTGITTLLTLAGIVAILLKTSSA